MSKKYPCKNLLCRINKDGSCNAEDMINLLCSSKDIYDSCKERVDGGDLLKVLGKKFNISIVKNNKGEVVYHENCNK
jgi:hypothetical protein